MMWKVAALSTAMLAVVVGKVTLDHQQRIEALEYSVLWEAENASDSGVMSAEPVEAYLTHICIRYAMQTNSQLGDKYAFCMPEGIEP